MTTNTLSPEQLAQLARLDSSSVSNAIETFDESLTLYIHGSGYTTEDGRHSYRRRAR